MNEPELQLMRDAIQILRETLDMLRATLLELQRNMVTVERFSAHENLDESRHQQTTVALTDVRLLVADLKGYFRGRTAVLAAVLAVVIPLLTEFVRVVTGH